MLSLTCSLVRLVLQRLTSSSLAVAAASRPGSTARRLLPRILSLQQTLFTHSSLVRPPVDTRGNCVADGLPAEAGAGRHDGEYVLSLLGGQVGVAQVAVRHRVHDPAQHLLSQPAHTSVKTTTL